MSGESKFQDLVYGLIGQVPAGYVTTYGDIAVLAGHAYAARIVGGMAHYGPAQLPWHRLVNRFGGLAAGFPGGREAQQHLLEAEGVTCTDFVVDNFTSKRWSFHAR